MRSELPSEHLPDICQSDAKERVGMDIEVTHAPLKPKRQFVRGHQCTGSLACQRIFLTAKSTRSVTALVTIPSASIARWQPDMDAF